MPAGWGQVPCPAALGIQHVLQAWACHSQGHAGIDFVLGEGALQGAALPEQHGSAYAAPLELKRRS